MSKLVVGIAVQALSSGLALLSKLVVGIAIQACCGHCCPSLSLALLFKIVVGIAVKACRWQERCAILALLSKLCRCDCLECRSTSLSARGKSLVLTATVTTAAITAATVTTAAVTTACCCCCLLLLLLLLPLLFLPLCLLTLFQHHNVITTARCN